MRGSGRYGCGSSGSLRGNARAVSRQHRKLLVHDLLHGGELIANNALYAQSGRAVYADGTTSFVTLLANAGTGTLVGVSAGFDGSGNIAVDFASAGYAGAPPMDLVPPGGRLAGNAALAHLPVLDFNGQLRQPQADIGAYRSNPLGNGGWPLQGGFKDTDLIFADGFEP